MTPSCFTSSHKRFLLNLRRGVRLWWCRWYWSTVPWAHIWDLFKKGLLHRRPAYKGRFLRQYSGTRRQHSYRINVSLEVQRPLKEIGFHQRLFFCRQFNDPKSGTIISMVLDFHGYGIFIPTFRCFYGIQHVGKDTCPIDPIG